MMSKDPQYNHTEQFIDKERWWNILLHFIEVLRVNIFIVDPQGRAILTPCRGRYGWKILETSPIGMDLLSQHSTWLEKFKQRGFYLEYQHQFDLHNFAVPIKIESGEVVAYLIVGPVILNKRLENEQYERIARELKIEPKVLLDAIGEIRTITFLGIKSILDLLDEVARYVINLAQQKQELFQLYAKAKFLPVEAREGAEKILSSLHSEEMLSLFLDIALKLTRAECGSVMVYDANAEELTIKVARGLNRKVMDQTRIKLGEGLAGLAAQGKEPFIIQGMKVPDNRVQQNSLNRPEIKKAFVLPILSNNRLLGVLNLHTKTNQDALTDDSLSSVQMLSQMATFAMLSSTS